MIMTDETWYMVRNTRGVHRFSGSGQVRRLKPIPLTEEEIIAMGVEKRESRWLATPQATPFAITDGALAVFHRRCIVRLSLDKNKVRVIVSMFGRETPVELELDQVELVDE